MKHNRIIVIGCPGSGKSTLSLQIGRKLDLPVIHIDQLFWRDNWQHISDKELNSLMAKELIKDRWIIDGNYYRMISERMKYCDTVIYLDYPRLTCFWVAIGRVVKYYGKTRPDVGGNCPERFDLDFLKFIWNFNRNHREKYQAMLSNTPDKDVFTLHHRKECVELLSKI